MTHTLIIHNSLSQDREIVWVNDRICTACNKCVMIAVTLNETDTSMTHFAGNTLFSVFFLFCFFFFFLCEFESGGQLQMPTSYSWLWMSLRGPQTVRLSVIRVWADMLVWLHASKAAGRIFKQRIILPRCFWIREALFLWLTICK